MVRLALSGTLKVVLSERTLEEFLGPSLSYQPVTRGVRRLFTPRYHLQPAVFPGSAEITKFAVATEL